MIPWLRRLFHKSRTESRLDKELRFHLEQQIADYTKAGMSAAEARRRAQLEFGGLERVKEEVRDTRWETGLDNLLRGFHYAFRSLRRDRRYAFIAIFALALGIGASTVVFSVFYNLLFNASAAKNASRLVIPVMRDRESVRQSGQDLEPLRLRLSDLNLVRRQNRVLENIVGYLAGGIVLVTDGLQMYQFYDCRVTSDAFDFYGVPALLGRGIAPEDGKPGASPIFVVSYKTWRVHFGGDPKVLGKSYIVDGNPRTLVGIMPQRFQAYGGLDQIWIPITSIPGTTDSDAEPQVALLARLKSGVSLERASADLDVIVNRLATLHPNDFPKSFTIRAEFVSDFLMGPRGGGAVLFSDTKHMLYYLLSAVMMLLLIACSNVANLLLARATTREKEMAVRFALGATRGRLVRQLLVESFVLAISACAVGCAFAWLGMKGVESIIHQRAWATVRGEAVIDLNSVVLWFAIGITLLTTVICGLAPALQAGRVDLQPRLVGSSNGANGSFRHGKIRAGLIIGEVALSIVLLVTAGLFMRSFFLLTHIDLGFDPRNILVIAIAPPRGHDQTPDRTKISSPEWQDTIRQVVERLKTLPGVEEVAVNNTIPGYGPSRGPQVTVPGSVHSEEAGLDECDEDCLETLKLRLVQGRWLSRTEVHTGRYVAVLSQRLARDFFRDKNPVGQLLQVKAFKQASQSPKDTSFEIIGVVADVKNFGPQNPAVPMAFIPPLTTGAYVLQVKTKVDPASLMHSIQEQVWAVDRDEVFWVFDPLPAFLQRLTYATPELALLMSAPMAGITLLLVVIGVFSVMAYSVSLQTHEIGVRMALGAQQSSILKMVLVRGVRLIASGIVIGLVASFALTRYLASQVWGISTTDPWTFAGVIMLVVLVGLAACLLPARRATRVDPLVALRYE